MRGAAA